MVIKRFVYEATKWYSSILDILTFEIASKITMVRSNMTRKYCKKTFAGLLFFCLSSFYNVSTAVEAGDVLFDGSILTVPYVEVGSVAYEIRLAPSNSSSLKNSDCLVTCLELVFAGPSSIEKPRNPPTFDGSVLHAPRVVVGENLFAGKFKYLSDYSENYFFSVTEADLAPIFSETDRQSWTSDELEAQYGFCRESAYRWDTPFPFGDFNNDGIEDFFVPIVCYQGPLPDFGGDNDVSVKSGWFFFCSNLDATYNNCSEKIFGEKFIDTSKNGGKGGSPYHHNTEEPKDLNGDGYLDFVLTINRDDGIGREKFDAISADGYQKAIDQCFSGDSKSADIYSTEDLGLCAYFSDQYVFLSKDDGTYSNIRVPWPSHWGHSVRSLPNDVGGFDLISIGYYKPYAARIDGASVIDVTTEYEGFDNFEEIAQVKPYVGGYFEFDGTGYWISNGISSNRITNLAEYSNFDIDTGFFGKVIGISLWKWLPGSGFEFSDYYIPPVTDFFNYTDEFGFEKTGLYQKGVPLFGGGQYLFMKQALLKLEEGSILVATGESNGFLEDIRRTVPDGFQVQSTSDQHVPDSLYATSVLEGCAISEGKITARLQPVIEGDVMFNSPGMYFRDFENDGLDDMVTITGMKVQGGAYINDGLGTLKRIDTNSILPSIPRTSVGNNMHLFWPLRNNGTLDILYMEVGSYNRPIFWNINDDNIFRAGDVGLIRSNYPISRFPLTTVDNVIEKFRECAIAPSWSWTCPY